MIKVLAYCTNKEKKKRKKKKLVVEKKKRREIEREKGWYAYIMIIESNVLP